MPRRRRGSAAAVVPRRGLLLRVLLQSPKDIAAGLVAFAVCSAIVANALFLQHGPHPAPMFGAGPATVPANPLPRPRPVQADGMSPEPKTAESKLNDSKLFDPRPVEQRPAEQKAAGQKAADQKVDDPLTDLVKATTSVAPANVPRPPAPIPGPITGVRRVAAVQRALTEYGYGQLKPTGMVGPDTRAAIEKFERERKLPVTGQMSD